VETITFSCSWKACEDIALREKRWIEFKPRFLEAAEQSLDIIKPLKESLLCFIKGEPFGPLLFRHNRRLKLSEVQAPADEHDRTGYSVRQFRI